MVGEARLVALEWHCVHLVNLRTNSHPVRGLVGDVLRVLLGCHNFKMK
jgi:hypothetical protein